MDGKRRRKGLEVIRYASEEITIKQRLMEVNQMIPPPTAKYHAISLSYTQSVTDRIPLHHPFGFWPIDEPHSLFLLTYASCSSKMATHFLFLASLLGLRWLGSATADASQIMGSRVLNVDGLFTCLGYVVSL